MHPNRYLLPLSCLSHLRKYLVVIFLIFFVYYFRLNILTYFYILQTYVTWHESSSGLITARDHFDTTMENYPLNQTTAGANYTDVVPAIIHHILIGDIDLKTRPGWIAAQQACLQWHPGYEYKFWNDTTAEELIRTHYPSFLSIWKNYPYAIQRADSLRYLVLHHYGGIFLDLDLHCRRSLGPLRRFEFISPSAHPVGISNGFLMVSARHPFFQVLVEQLPLFNRNFLLPYATVMFSTGCMYISAQYSLYPDRCHLRLLDYKQHRLSGRRSTPLFHHHGSSSWHANDASFIKMADNILKKCSEYRILVLILLCSTILTLAYFYRKRRRIPTSEKHHKVLIS